MDDGSYTSKKNRTYRLNTQSFPFGDQQTLLEALKINFDIDATIQKDRSNYMLYIRSKSAERFVNLIRPYIHPCFDYKMKAPPEGCPRSRSLSLALAVGRGAQGLDQYQFELLKTRASDYTAPL